MSNLNALSVIETILRANQVCRDESGSEDHLVTINHLEKILCQLLLDFS